MLFYSPMTCLNKAVMVILRNGGRGLEIYTEKMRFPYTFNYAKKRHRKYYILDFYTLKK